MGIDFRKYTVDEIAKQLAVIEIHLRQFALGLPDNFNLCQYIKKEMGSQLTLLQIHLRQFDDRNPIFCLECSGKHLLAIEGLAAEGQSQFPENAVVWKQLGEWANNIRETAAAVGNKLQAAIVANWTREAGVLGEHVMKDTKSLAGKISCMASLNSHIAIHLAAISGLADEGVTFFEESTDKWKLVGSWARETIDVIGSSDFDRADASKAAEFVRNQRKVLQKEYMQNIGQCECVTGKEPCCHMWPKAGA